MSNETESYNPRSMYAEAGVLWEKLKKADSYTGDGDQASARDILSQLLRESSEQREMLTEVIHTFYMNDNDETTWAGTGLGKRIADHLGLKSTRPDRNTKR